MAEKGDIENLGINSENNPDLLFLAEAGQNPRVAKFIEEQRALLTPLIPGDTERNHALRVTTERLLSFAMIDGLTGLKNQEGYKDALGLELQRMQRLGAPLAKIFADLDNFKVLNDRFGHQAGDAFLRELGNFLRRFLRPTDIAGRLGGDEIGIALPGVSNGSIVVASRFLDGLSSLDVPGFPQARGIVSASIGIAVAGPKDTVESFYNNGDQGAYWSKALGKGCISVMPTPGVPYKQLQDSGRIHFISPNAGPPPILKGR